jgi:hypothetical protein
MFFFVNQKVGAEFEVTYTRFSSGFVKEPELKGRHLHLHRAGEAKHVSSFDDATMSKRSYLIYLNHIWQCTYEISKDDRRYSFQNLSAGV